MLDPDDGPAATEASIDDAVVERAAERADVETDALLDALVVLHAELIGRHGQYERAYDYVTVDGTRAYRVDDIVWGELLGEFSLPEDVGQATRAAHTEQARLLFASSVGADDNFGADEAGVVIGVDTAEQF
jgi:hypothetical protein